MHNINICADDEDADDLENAYPTSRQICGKGQNGQIDQMTNSKVQNSKNFVRGN